MKQKNILRIVLSSPGDVADEHAIVEEVIRELNRGVADFSNILFEVTRWKTDAYPGFHADGPQGLIDPVLDIENCDILIGIFWKRFGKPTRQAASGTEHEFLKAYQSWQEKGSPQIMMYFRDTAVSLPTSAEVEQYQQVIKFRENFPPEGLYWTFGELPQFERLIRNHLTQYLKHQIPGDLQPKISKSKTDQPEILRNYCLKLKARHSTISLFGEKDTPGAVDPKVLNRMRHIDTGFLPLYLQAWNDQNETTSPLEISEVFFNENSVRHFLLRGLPGSGKTTLLRYLTYCFASFGATRKKEYIPVFLRCKAIKLKNATLEEYVMQQINEDCDSRTSYAVLTGADYFLETPMILLFDGLDEIEDLDTSKNFNLAIEKLVKKYPRCKVIVSSRPRKLQLEDFPSFRALDVMRLSSEMIAEYLNKWFNNNTKQINNLKNMLETKPRIQALATNPFLLSMICFTYENGGDTALIARRSDLYANCTRFLLERLYDPAGRPNLAPDYSQSLEILKDLSLRFFLWQEADFPVDHVNVIGERILPAETLGKTADFLDEVQRQTGLIQRAKEGFTFVHRSLWEYFTALALLEDKTLRFVIRHAANPDWEEVIRLYAGLLRETEQTTALIQGLWNINRPLALRVTTEVAIPAKELIKPLVEKEAGNQSKLLLIDALEQSLPLIPGEEQPNLLQETLNILLGECSELDCQVIWYAQQLLQKNGLQPLAPGGLIYRLLHLEQAAERQREFLNDPENCFNWVKLKGGTFWMGDDDHEDNEKPVHQVKLISFWMSKHPVTNRLLARFPLGDKYPNYGGDHHPAIGNTWWEAYYFALWLNARLPTEAEWEYAVRGGTQNIRTQYYFGDSAEELKAHAWFYDSVSQIAHAVDELNPVTGKENLNPVGLANMSGNVREWCSDWYAANYYQACKGNGIVENPTGPETGSGRVLRGGSWYDRARYCRSALRDRYDPGDRSDFTGFRLVFVP